MSHPSPSLPASPNLEHLRNQAKALLSAIKAHDPAALARLNARCPDFKGPIGLATAQRIVAREHGFPSWPRLKAYLESLAGPRSNHRRPLKTDREYFEDRARGLVRSFQDGIPSTLAQLREFCPRFASMTDDELRSAELTLTDARLAVAREHGFESWRAFGRHLRDLQVGRTTEPFLMAFEAIELGDAGRLRALLEQYPSLVNAPGTNGNTLLNLAGACKQIECSEALIAAGADVNVGNKYGWTPLHQAAYSNQIDLARKLIEAGGSLTLSGRGDGGTPLVQALFWGHRELAEELARYGIAPCNLRVAAGLGRLDLVESFFDSSGHLLPEAGLHRQFYRPHPGFPTWTPTDDPQQILDEALLYAVKNGRIEILPFLVKKGADVNGAPGKMTALEWAAMKGHVDAIEWLVEHGADPNRQSYGDESTFQSPLHSAASSGQMASVKCLLKHGADTTLRDSAFDSTAIGWANHFNQTEIRDYLLNHGVVGMGDAISFGRVDRVAELLDADPAAVNRPISEQAGDSGSEPEVPLLLAVQNNQPAVVRLLLDRGANPHPSLGRGRPSLLQRARNAGFEEVAAILESATERPST